MSTEPVAPDDGEVGPETDWATDTFTLSDVHVTILDTIQFWLRRDSLARSAAIHVEDEFKAAVEDLIAGGYLERIPDEQNLVRLTVSSLQQMDEMGTIL